MSSLSHRSFLRRSLTLALIVAVECVACKRDAPSKKDGEEVEGIVIPASPSAPSQPTASADVTSIEVFYKRFRLAVLQRDRSYVANQLRYPIDISSSSAKNFTIKDSSEFLSRYEEVMTERLARSISDQTTTEPSLGPVRVGTIEGSYLTIFHVCEDAPGEICRAGPIRVLTIHLGPR